MMPYFSTAVPVYLVDGDQRWCFRRMGERNMVYCYWRYRVSLGENKTMYLLCYSCNFNNVKIYQQFCLSFIHFHAFSFQLYQFYSFAREEHSLWLVVIAGQGHLRPHSLRLLIFLDVIGACHEWWFFMIEFMFNWNRLTNYAGGLFIVNQTMSLWASYNCI